MFRLSLTVILYISKSKVNISSLLTKKILNILLTKMFKKFFLHYRIYFLVRSLYRENERKRLFDYCLTRKNIDSLDQTNFRI